MIKINKDLNAIPSSLIPAYPDLFPDRVGTRLVAVPQPSRTTHQRRLDVIKAGAYNDSDSFNNRYKSDDVRQALMLLYKSKCAFCEQKIEQYHIEHYRPKNIYYWLAFSWDNLLMACPTCNEHKETNFDLDGAKVIFQNTEAILKAINSQSAGYDVDEVPKLVNPEVTDPLNHIQFQKDGQIESTEPRFAYTINQCQINRKTLNDSRRAILDRFREYIASSLVAHASSTEAQTASIATNVRNFFTDSKNQENDFLAFRRYAISNGWLNEIVKEQAD